MQYNRINIYEKPWHRIQQAQSVVFCVYTTLNDDDDDAAGGGDVDVEMKTFEVCEYITKDKGEKAA